MIFIKPGALTRAPRRGEGRVIQNKLTNWLKEAGKFHELEVRKSFQRLEGRSSSWGGGPVNAVKFDKKTVGKDRL